MDVGQRLKIRRKELGFTQDYVAAELGITRQTMSNWENGRSYPDIERIIRLSELYNLSLDELLKGEYRGQPLLEDFYCSTFSEWTTDAASLSKSINE